jgi:hypothetical protein
MYYVSIIVFASMLFLVDNVKLETDLDITTIKSTRISFYQTGTLGKSRILFSRHDEHQIVIKLECCKFDKWFAFAGMNDIDLILKHIKSARTVIDA